MTTKQPIGKTFARDLGTVIPVLAKKGETASHAIQRVKASHEKGDVVHISPNYNVYSRQTDPHIPPRPLELTNLKAVRSIEDNTDRLGDSSEYIFNKSLIASIEKRGERLVALLIAAYNHPESPVLIKQRLKTAIKYTKSALQIGYDILSSNHITHLHKEAILQELSCVSDIINDISTRIEKNLTFYHHLHELVYSTRPLIHNIEQKAISLITTQIPMKSNVLGDWGY